MFRFALYVCTYFIWKIFAGRRNFAVLQFFEGSQKYIPCNFWKSWNHEIFILGNVHSFNRENKFEIFFSFFVSDRAYIT